jgi:predicted Zn finger-like uncharacterized protein
MPTIIACPACQTRLNIPESLLGQSVRCPSCATAFEAPAAEPFLDVPLQLSLDEPPSSTPVPPALPGAVEIKLSLDDNVSPAIPPPSVPPMPEPLQAREVPLPTTARPRLPDDHDDTKECPHCGTVVHHQARRCLRCGERLGRRRYEDDDDRPRRRDCEPHRGGLVLSLGVMALLLSFVCGPVGLVLGLLAWVLGQMDLAKMKEGSMDDDGLGMTQAGWICGMIGSALGLLWSLGCLSLWALWSQPTSSQPPPPRFGGGDWGE